MIALERAMGETTMVDVAILGCGYVGMAVARHWREQGLRIAATTTRPERLAELESIADRALVMRGSDLAAFSDLLAGGVHTLLICLAAGRQGDYCATYLATAQTLMHYLEDYQLEDRPGLGQIIFTSTCSVYGDYGGAWVTEADPPRPLSPNGTIMLTTEQTLLTAATDRRQVAILRLGGIYGPGRELATIYRSFAGTVRPGRGNQPTNWVHLKDIVGAIAFVRQQSLGGIYNLVQDEIPSRRGLVDRVCRAYNLAAVSWDPTQLETSAYHGRISNQKLKGAGYGFQQPTFLL